MERQQRVDEILEFWFGAGDDAGGGRRVWFVPDPAFDTACTIGFLADHELADAGGLDDWRNEPRSALALILLFDQFPRNMFRGDAEQFATDQLALAIAKAAVGKGFDQQVQPDERAFLYMPFQHSEDLDDQNRSLLLFAELGDPRFIPYAQKHHDIIERFGRFPHRNSILGRSPRADEIAAGDVFPW